MAPKDTSIHIAGGVAHFALHVRLKPEELVELIASLSFDETEELLTHDKVRFASLANSTVWCLLTRARSSSSISTLR